MGGANGVCFTHFAFCDICHVGPARVPVAGEQMDRMVAPTAGGFTMSKPSSAMRELSSDELDGVSGGESKGAAAASHDRRKAGLDNIQKLLDIVRSMNPQI